jgi:hypothetical protein
MSYSVKLTDGVVQKLSGCHLSSRVIGEILRGLDALASNPARQLIRIGPPSNALQFDRIVNDVGPPRRDVLFTFTVLYGADEETLFVVECELLAEDHPPSWIERSPNPTGCVGLTHSSKVANE